MMKSLRAPESLPMIVSIVSVAFLSMLWIWKMLVSSVGLVPARYSPAFEKLSRPASPSGSVNPWSSNQIYGTPLVVAEIEPRAAISLRVVPAVAVRVARQVARVGHGDRHVVQICVSPTAVLHSRRTVI